MNPKSQFDAFISYSSQDRKAVITPFLKAAKKRNINAWCDIHEITWGDSIVEKIHEGMRNATFIIVFITHSYLNKPWPLKELKASLAKQLAGGPQVLPVLLGVSVDEVNYQLPFLSDIKHLSLPSYDSTSSSPAWFIEQIIDALEQKREKQSPFRFGDADLVASLKKRVCAASFDSHYETFSMLSTNESVEIHLRWMHEKKSTFSLFREHVELPPVLGKFFREHGISDTKKVACAWADMRQSPFLYFALSSGNLFKPHRADLHNKGLGYPLKSENYINIGAPSNPLCMTLLERSNQVVLGYEDGTLFPCDGSGMLLKTRSSPVTSLDASTETILVSGYADGGITIWSRTSWLPLHNFISGDPVLNLSVCRYGNPVFATGHPGGRISIWSFQGESLRSFVIDDAPTLPMAFFPDGYEYLAIGSHNTVQIWNYQTGKLLQKLQVGHSEIVTLHIVPSYRSWSRDDILQSRITAGCADGMVYSWSVTF